MKEKFIKKIRKNNNWKIRILTKILFVFVFSLLVFEKAKGKVEWPPLIWDGHWLQTDRNNDWRWLFEDYYLNEDIFPPDENAGLVKHEQYVVIIDKKKGEAAIYVHAPKKEMTIEIPESESGYPIVAVYTEHTKQEIEPVNLKLSRYVREVEFDHVQFDGVKSFEVVAGNENLKAVDGVLYKRVVYKGKTTWALYRYPNRRMDESFMIPEGVKVISSFAFRNENLKNVTFPKSIKKICRWAFTQSSVSRYYIPKGIEKIGTGALHGAKKVVFEEKSHIKELNLSNIAPLVVRVPKGVKILKRISVADNGKVILPEGLKKIRKKAFQKNVIKKLVLPKSLKKIKPYIFSGLSMKKLVLPEGIRDIQNYAFSGSKIKTIVIPKSVKKIGKNSFVKYGNGKGQIPIKVYKGSYAHRFAKKHGLLFFLK